MSNQYIFLQVIICKYLFIGRYKNKESDWLYGYKLD